ncbi:hypothetical protein HAX54_040743 [Datura stramonium]|uniref:Uncharacterized protein n=1 Tax=Datura stramonium TaxID=4076 RepID=A0ABS8VS59_DATST|nr:hypothetical protein [Datura stramonium]
MDGKAGDIANVGNGRLIAPADNAQDEAGLGDIENSPNKVLHEIITHQIGENMQENGVDGRDRENAEDKEEGENLLVMDWLVKNVALSPKSNAKGIKGKSRLNENSIPTKIVPKRGAKSTSR